MTAPSPTPPTMEGARRNGGASRCVTELTPEPLYIEGDVFALGRVYRNLIFNAIQATAPGRPDRRRREGARRPRPGAGLRHRLRHSSRAAPGRSSRTSSRRSGAASDSGWRSQTRSSSSSAAASVASEVGKGTTFVHRLSRARWRGRCWSRAGRSVVRSRGDLRGSGPLLQTGHT